MPTEQMATQGMSAEKSEVDGNECFSFDVLLFHTLYTYMCSYCGFLP